MLASKEMIKKLFYLSFAAALIMTTGCVQLNPPEINHTGTDFSFLSLQEVLAKSHFSIKNNNPVGLHGAIEYELWINENQFSSGISSTVEVDANAQTSFTINSRIDIVKVFGTLLDLTRAVAAGKASVPFQLKGKFKSDVLGIPVEAPISASGQIPLPKLPSNLIN